MFATSTLLPCRAKKSRDFPRKTRGFSTKRADKQPSFAMHELTQKRPHQVAPNRRLKWLQKIKIRFHGAPESASARRGFTFSRSARSCCRPFSKAGAILGDPQVSFELPALLKAAVVKPA